MELLWIVLLGLFIGAVLGGLGGGGAILTVPALVYVVGQSAQDATTSSLVIVGLTAVVGALSYVGARRVRWGLGLTFAAIGLPATFLGSYANHRIDENALLLAFSVLMVVAAVAMAGTHLRRPSAAAGADGAPGSARAPVSAGTDRLAPTGSAAHTSSRTSVLERDDSAGDVQPRPSRVAVVATALGVGLLTGFFGVGGGFVIVPALVLVLRLPMQLAVGTSLVIVALNSATSLLSRVTVADFDWGVIVPFTLAAMVATLAGKRVADRLSGRQLKLGFAALLVLVAGYTAWQSVDGLRASDVATPAAPGAPAAPATTATSEADVIVSPAEVETALVGGAVALDVRTPEEFDAGHLEDALNIDLADPDFRALVGELPRDETYVVYCASGNRAGQALELMVDLGFTDLVNGGGFVDLVAQTSLAHT